MISKSFVLKMRQVFFILIGLLLDFSTATPKNWIITLSQETEVEAEYFHLRDAATKGSKVKDPFYDKSAAELNDICLELKNSRIYQRICNLKFPEPSHEPLIPNDQKECGQNTWYKQRRLNEFSERKEEQIPVFYCQTHESRTYWLTYGFSDHHLFLLQDADDGKAVSFIGQSELIPTIDDQYTRGESLDKFYYQEANPRFEASKPKEKYPPAIISSIQFRLCCVVHAARQNGNEDEISFTMNYANSDPQSMSRNHHVRSHQKFAWEQQQVQALGCTINPKNADDVDFYLRYSTEDANAVFVLDPEMTDDGKKILNVNHYIRNVKLPILSAFSRLGI